jgi:hypothetical protein
MAADATVVGTHEPCHDTLVPDPQVQKEFGVTAHIDLALGPRPRAHQAGMAAADPKLDRMIHHLAAYGKAHSKPKPTPSGSVLRLIMH